MQIKENEMYLVKGNKFWHCKYNCNKDRQNLILIRVGDINSNIIDLMSVTVAPPIVSTSLNEAISDEVCDQKSIKLKVLLAETYQFDNDPSGYYVSEKLDGMRAIWKNGILYSRNGIPIRLPGYFKDGWPEQTLDGELWLGRSKFQELVSIVKRQASSDDEWQQIKYMIFDLPDSNQTFSLRLSEIQKICIKSGNPNLKCIDQKLCEGKVQLNKELQRVQQLGGEGLMLRDPNSLYVFKRSKTLLKVKTFNDNEAEVIGYEDGIGKFQNSVGALKVRTHKGLTFSVGSGMTNELRKNPPQLGSIVTYKYYGVTNDGKPRFPIFLRVRENDT